MCGIVGAVAKRNVVPILIEGLKRLEYRGYDSAGIAVLNGSLQRVRSTGRVAELEKAAQSQGVTGEVGIAHTRWATHGVPSERNAHPHISGGISLVHNGIIENHETMRQKLRAQGYEFVSDTDTEVIAHLVHSHCAGGGSLFDAVRRATAELIGAYAIAVLSEKDRSRLIVARHGAPLLLGMGEGETFAASDASALVQVTQNMIYLEDGDCAEITLAGARIVDGAGKPITRPVHVSQLTAAAVELGAYRHFMQKEIFEQPMAMANTLELVTSARTLSPNLFGVDAEKIFSQSNQILILACGTSYHAGMVAHYWLESVAGVPCSRDRQRIPLSRIRARSAYPGNYHFAIGRNRRHAGSTATRESDRPAPQPVDLQRARIGVGACIQPAVFDARRAGDRRRVHQGVYHAVGGAGVTDLGDRQT